MQDRHHRLSCLRSHLSPTPLTNRGSTQKPIPLVSPHFRTCPYAQAGPADHPCQCSLLAGRNDHPLPQIRVSLRKPQAPALEFPPQLLLISALAYAYLLSLLPSFPIRSPNGFCSISVPAQENGAGKLRLRSIACVLRLPSSGSSTFHPSSLIYEIWDASCLLISV